MRIIFMILSGITLIACGGQQQQVTRTGDNSRNALDWSGIYAGWLGSDSVQTVIRLNENDTYQMERTVKDSRPETSDGSFEWNKEGGAIAIDGKSYRVGENRLDLLNEQGQPAGSLVKLDNPLQEKYWKLTELYGNPVTTAEGQREAYVIFRSFDNRYHGNGGCNGYSGAYELLDNGRIKLLPAISTQMACQNGMDTETGLHDVLRQVDTYIVNGDTMVLTKARMAPMAMFEAVYLR